MIRLDNEHMVACDVDDTLLIWDYHNIPVEDRITIQDPYTQQNKTYGVHRPHIQLLKQYKARGYTIAVWTKGGSLHAESAVNALQLSDIVDFAMAKPEKVVDDKSDVFSIVGPVVYLKP